MLILCYPASDSRPWSEGTGETPEFWSEAITLLAAEHSLFTQQQETTRGNLCWSGGAAAFISSAWTCEVERDSEWERARRLSGRQAGRQRSIYSGPGDQSYGLPCVFWQRSGGWSRKSWHCFARRASLDKILRFWCFRVVCVGTA